MPKKTIFSFDFISFFIEKTQICLILKLTKVICILKKTSSSNSIVILSIKLAFALIVIIGVVFLLNKIDFPAPKKEIEKIIPNENFKIIK